MGSLTRTLRRRKHTKTKKAAIKWYKRRLKEKAAANNQRPTQG